MRYILPGKDIKLQRGWDISQVITGFERCSEWIKHRFLRYKDVFGHNFLYVFQPRKQQGSLLFVSRLEDTGYLSKHWETHTCGPFPQMKC